jgi:hypothetical protein
VTALTLALILLASVQKKEKRKVIEKNYSTVSLSEGSFLREPKETYEHNDRGRKNVESHQPTLDFLECFNARKNLEMLFQTDLSPQSIPAINGIKYILKRSA